MQVAVKTMAQLNTQPSVENFQSSGALSVIPISRESGILKTENAYACPMQRWIASAAGGTRQRLNPGGATECERSRNESAGIGAHTTAHAMRAPLPCAERRRYNSHSWVA